MISALETDRFFSLLGEKRLESAVNVPHYGTREDEGITNTRDFGGTYSI